MSSKNSLLNVPGLKLTGKIEHMSDRIFEGYLSTVNTFIDQFPSTATKMRNSLIAKSYDDVRKCLTDVSTSLIRLHASDLAEDCRKLLNSFAGNVDHDTAEAAMENFIHSVDTLSIDVQMAMRGVRASAPEPRRQAPVAQTPGFGSRAVILAVDNAIMFLNTLKRLLEGSPYELQCVSSGDQALKYLQENPRPDLILLDIEMPGMDGYELARRIKNSGIKSPMIFITANSDRSYVEKAIEVGAMGLLVKPLRGPQLIAKIREYI